ncbi:MAG: glycoside hydrolase family 10 protein [Anaerolineae bacterium]
MRAKSLGLFLLLTCLVFLLLFALAGTANRRLMPQATGTALPLVPALVVSDRHDWAQNGALAQISQGAPEELPIAGWQVFEVTRAGASFTRDAGETYLALQCPGGPCIAGLYQRHAELPAGDYTLEADVYLENRAQEGSVSARLGWDESGGTDPMAETVHWWALAPQSGWQRLSCHFEHQGGSTTVFVVFNRLSSDADCRIAAIRLLGPPAPPTVAIELAPTPTALAEEDGILPVELRALYVGVQDWQWSGAEELQAVIDRATAANFNALYFQVRDLGYAYYDSAVEPRAPLLAASADWDPLAEAVRRGHEAGLQVHAWLDLLPVWRGEQPPASSTPEHMYNLFSARYGASWLQGQAEGVPPATDALLYASPAHEQVRSYLAAVCRDIASRYDVDGLHLTYLRYAGPDYGQDAASREAFNQAQAGRSTLTYPDWQREQVTALLVEVQRAVQEIRPQVQLSVGVWPVYLDKWHWQSLEGYEDLHEDSQGWLANGHVDALVPQLYVDDQYQLPGRVIAIVQDYLSRARGRIVVPALGADRDYFVSLALAITQAREAGASGVAIFSYAGLEQRGYWDDLARGPFVWPASVPPMPWKETD